MISLREYLMADVSAAEQAGLDAHRATATVSASVLKELRRARRLRWIPLVWISPWLRQYLATFIEKLERELDRREIKRLSPSRHGSRSRRGSRSETSAEAEAEAEAQAPRAIADESAAAPMQPGIGDHQILSQFEKGLRRAKEVTRKEPREAAYWLRRATSSRRRWVTRLFNPRKRRFLDGFIDGLEQYFASHPELDHDAPRRESKRRARRAAE